MMIKTRIRNKRDTLNNWTAKNPILLSGEIAITDDGENIKLKIGDGVTPYNSLSFYDSEFVTATQLNSKAPAYQYSTTDLTAGVSELATGTIYIVYE